MEKATELGVWRLRWLRTAHGQGRIPKRDRSFAWMIGALEQSRGAWLTRIDHDWSTLDDLPPGWSAAESGGDEPVFGSDATVAVGPEGGGAPPALPASAARADLGSRILRTETAVLALAALAGVPRGPAPPT